MEAKTAVDLVQDPKIFCQEHGRNLSLCMKNYDPDKEVGESHVKEVLRIDLAGSDSKGSDCLLDQDKYLADMRVSAPTVAWIG